MRKTSLVDYPNRVTTVLYTPDCNLRCPYCHNWRIVLDPQPPFLNEESALRLVKSRKKYVQTITVTGGEPTIHKELPKFLKKLKENEFSTKLDTNGFFPKTLKESLLYLDYVALDVKTSTDKYQRLGAKNTSKLLESIELLKNGEIDYEFRTTVVPSFVDEEDIHKIGDMVKGGKRFALQQYVAGDTLDKKFKVKPYNPKTIHSFAKQMKGYIDELILRI